MRKYNYVIYHKNCLDGFSGFFILSLTKTIANDAIIYPDDPHTKNIPPGIENKDVIIIDVAYKKDIISEIFKLTKTTTFIDHHVSIRDDVLSLRPTENHKIIYNDAKSGASLTWNYFFKNNLPLFVKYVEDNDIGAWKLKYTIPFIDALRVEHKLIPTKENLNLWKKLLSATYCNKLIKKGLLYGKYKDFLIKNNLKKYSVHAFPSEKIYNMNPNIFNKIGQYKVIVHNGSCPDNSILGRTFLDKYKNYDFIILWNYQMDDKKYVLSLRSRDVDVGEIAKIFGGGGHKLASACSFYADNLNINDLFTNEKIDREYN
jgi:oligoribonuclease NrnB/cAMP/cGMP phosphodiesterase (DHH superfamily)